MSVVHMHCKLQVCIPTDAHACFGAMLVVLRAVHIHCTCMRVAADTPWGVETTSVVFKMWDLGDSIDSIACMRAEVAVYRLLAVLQVRTMLYVLAYVLLPVVDVPVGPSVGIAATWFGALL